MALLNVLGLWRSPPGISWVLPNIFLEVHAWNFHTNWKWGRKWVGKHFCLFVCCCCFEGVTELWSTGWRTFKTLDWLHWLGVSTRSLKNKKELKIPSVCLEETFQNSGVFPHLCSPSVLIPNLVWLQFGLTPQSKSVHQIFPNKKELKSLPVFPEETFQSSEVFPHLGSPSILIPNLFQFCMFGLFFGSFG